MSWIFGDTFDTYATADLGTRYSLLSGSGYESIHAGTGRGSTQSVRFSNASGLIGRGIPSTTATITVHLAYIANGSVGTEALISFWNAVSGRQQLVIRVNNNGSISAIRGFSNEGPLQVNGTLLGSSASGLITADTYVQIGVTAKIHGSTGIVTIYINGAAVLTLTGQNTQGTGAGNLNVDTIIVGGSNHIDLDDFVITDDVDTGDGCVGFLGDVIGEAVAVTGNGTTTQWTPSSSTNASCVDDTSPDGDSTTVSSGNVGDLDLYTHGALSRIDSGIKCVQVVTIGKKSTAGTRALNHAVRVGSTNYLGPSDIYLGTAYAAQISPFALNPATSAAWAVSAVNTMELGQKVTV